MAQASNNSHQRVEVLQLQQFLGGKYGGGGSVSPSRPSGEKGKGLVATDGEAGHAGKVGTSATCTKCVMTSARCVAVGLLRIMSWTHCETLLKREMNRSRTGLSTVQP